MICLETQEMSRKCACRRMLGCGIFAIFKFGCKTLTFLQDFEP
jgi:hypothetical protein